MILKCKCGLEFEANIIIESKFLNNISDIHVTCFECKEKIKIDKRKLRIQPTYVNYELLYKFE